MCLETCPHNSCLNDFVASEFPMNKKCSVQSMCTKYTNETSKELYGYTKEYNKVKRTELKLNKVRERQRY